MAWTKYANVARDRWGGVIGSVKIIVDYNSSSADRIAALLEIKDWNAGADDTITIDPSDASSTTWTEGEEFNATSSNNTTAENIAAAIDSTTDYTASETATGASGNPYVSIVYTAGGHIDSLSSSNTSAWDFYTLNATNDAIIKLASDDGGTIKHQPIFTNSNGQFYFYVDAPVDIDIYADKDGKTFDNDFTTDITVAT